MPGTGGHQRRPHVLLGVTGGVAAYKAVELCRLLQRMGMDVTVAQTRASLDFVGTATFAALTGRPVLTDADPASPSVGPCDGGEADGIAEADRGTAGGWNDAHADGGVFPHLDAARDADVVVIAPATAHTIAQLAAGLAGSVLTASCLAARGPLVVAPAMNTRMLEHPATRRNLATLAADGAVIVEPESGLLACGDEGAGRLAAIERIAAAVERSLAPRDLAGRVVLVTAGGTSEPIDDVRSITNRSTGRMGIAVARAAAARGADVRLVVTGSVDASLLTGVAPVATVGSALDLEAAVREHAEGADVVVMAAAVSDFTVDRTPGKLARGDATTLTLVPTRDIVGSLGAARAGSGDPAHPVLVAFAAESGADGIDRARAKLVAKQVDMVVFNDVSRSDIGFGAAENEVTLITAGGETHVGRRPKDAVAHAILDRLTEIGSRAPAGPA